MRIAFAHKLAALAAPAALVLVGLTALAAPTPSATAQTSGPGGFSIGGGPAPGGLIPEDEAALAPIAGVRVVLRGLDKLTGEVQTFEAPVGGEARFDRLRVEVKACFARTAARAPESTVFLQIYDTKPDPAALAFSGWMFASSPALSAMDHSRYDVWVLSCNTS